MDVTASVLELIERLTGAPDPDIASDLARLVEPVELASGERLFSEGDDADAAYFVIAGRVAITRTDTDGKETLLSVFGRGEVVGEMGLLHTAPRSATVTAIRPARLLRLAATDFESMVSRHPRVLRSITTTVLDRLSSPGRLGPLVGTIAVACGPGIDAADVLEVLSGEMMRFDRVAVQPALDVPTDSLSETLDRMETRHRHVLIDAGREPGAWMDMAVTRSDRVLVVVGPDGADHATAVFGRIGGVPFVERWLAVVQPIGPGAGSGVSRVSSPDVVVTLEPGSRSDLRRVARLVSGHGTGLALGGGGARALAHIGALRALEEAGIEVDAVSGASMGALIAASIAQGESAESLTRLAPGLFRRLLDRTYPAVALYSGKKVVAALGARFGGWSFEDLDRPFLCTSVNLTSSRLVVHRSGPLVPALRAGSAVPGLFPPVPHDGELLVDGGLLDNLPVDPLRRSGMVERVIAVDVAPPLGPRAKTDFGLSVSGWTALGSGRHPRISAVLMRSMLIGAMAARDEGVATGAADLYLDLDLRGIPLLEFDDVGSIIERGYEAAAPRVRAWSGDVEVPGGLSEAEA